MGKEASSIESVVGFERDTEELGIRFHFELLKLSAVTRQFAIHRHKIAYFNVVTGRRLAAPE